MNRPCPDRQDRITGYVLGALDAAEAETLREHLSECSACRQYLQDLKQQSESLIELGRQIGGGMAARQDRVLEALEAVAPAEPVARHAFPFFGRCVKTAVAAVLLLGAGITIGRWTAPRPVDIEQLRADLEASLKPVVQTSVLAQVDKRLQAEAQQRAQLAERTHQDLRVLAQQLAAGAESLEDQMKGRFAQLVDIIEAGRETDRWRVEKALQKMKMQTGMGLQALSVRAGDSAATVHD